MASELATEPAVADVLRRIVARRRERIASATTEPSRRSAVPGSEPLDRATQPFLRALVAKRGRAVVAEIKLGSPRLGSLAGRFDPVAVACAYAANGAAALSVVVEPDFFFGSYDLLRSCRAASGLPAIAKDFVVDPVQLEWAKEAGADAVLLIAALLSRDELRAYASRARALGLVPLVETHDAADAAKLAGAGWELVGVNHRDLRDFSVDLEAGRRLLPSLPAGALRVAESGLKTAGDLRRLAGDGFDAFLIGEALVTDPDPGSRLQELLAG